MLVTMMYARSEIVTMDRAYVNYAKFEELTERDVVYFTKMKKNLSYEILTDCMDMTPGGKVQYREQAVVFWK